MKTVFRNKHKKPSFQIAENKIKEIRSLLIKLPALVLLISTYLLIEVSPPAATWLILFGFMGLLAIV